jgi:hypothetical protein
MNWKEKAQEILKDETCEELDKFLDKWRDPETGEEFIRTYIVDAMVRFAKLACEEQKKICADNSLVLGENETDEGEESFTSDYFINNSLYGTDRYSVDKESILNSPIVKFEENE